MATKQQLFPACAGVILVVPVAAAVICAFPRLRGGDPLGLLLLNQGSGFSPPARG